MLYFFDLEEKEGRYYVFAKNLELIKADKFSFDTTEFKKDINDAYLSLPIAWLDFRILELPFKDEKKIREALPFELEGLILSSLDEITYDFIILEKAEKTKILAIYIKKDLLQDLIEKFGQKKISIKAITCIQLRQILTNFKVENLLNIELSEKERIQLAQQELTSPSFNLHKPDLITPIQWKKQKRILRWTILLLILNLIFWTTDFGLNWWIIKKQTTEIKNKMYLIYSDLFPKEKKVISPLYQFQSHFKTLKDKEPIFTGISPLKILLKLSEIKRYSVVFREIHMGKNRVLLKGVADSLSDVDSIRQELEQIWSQAKVLDTKILGDQKIHFTIMAEAKEK
ncbi:MAG: hypothetical protein LWW94_05875 [Candidatus Desulfofervidaceae bacterium]|nr:hypothetical protein [Candidatus Desulfofervidaceae bacterium]